MLREGNIIALANTSLEVAEACSGIRSLVTLLALAATLACLTGMGTWRGLTLLAASVPIAVVANAARVAGTGILAYHYGPARRRWVLSHHVGMAPVPGGRRAAGRRVGRPHGHRAEARPA